MCKPTGVYATLWEGWSPSGRVLVASGSRRTCPQYLIWREEPVPAPALPLASAARRTRLSWVIWGVPCLVSTPHSWGSGSAEWRGSCTGVSVSPQTPCSQPQLGIAFEELLLLHHLPRNGSSTTDALTKAKPTPQRQQFPKKQTDYFPLQAALKI